MCGYLLSAGRGKIQAKTMLESRLRRRGPDDYQELQGEWFEIFHSRLAVQESFENDRQPYVVDNRYILVYNGEIYNYVELRTELRKSGVSITNDGDTEVLAKGLAHEGRAFLNRLNGMFSFVFIDLKTREILLARDRLGIKPLYYSLAEGLMVSTNPSLLASILDTNFNEAVIGEVLNFRYELGTQTTFEKISSLAPGHWASWRMGDNFKIDQYWGLPEDESLGSLDEFKSLLDSSIELRTRSKRRVTSLLSSGLDSSYLSLEASRLGAITESYTLELTENQIDVLGAKSIAQKAGIHSHLISSKKFTFENWLTEWDQALQHLELPVADTIIGPTNLLFKEISKDYAVALSGEGADELLAGYVHHAVIKKTKWLRMCNHFPAKIGAQFLNLIWPLVKGLSPYPGRFGQIERVKLKKFLSESDPRRALEILTAITGRSHKSLAFENVDYSLKSAQVFDIAHWLPNYTLRRLDYISAAYGVEARVPYLDHRLVEFVLRNPSHILNGEMGDKHPLRYAHQKSYERFGVWKNKKTPFVMSHTDFISPGLISVMTEEIQRAKSNFEVIDRFCEQNEIAKLLLRAQVLSPLESKILFSCFLTARWLRIQSEQKHLDN